MFLFVSSRSAVDILNSGEAALMTESRDGEAERGVSIIYGGLGLIADAGMRGMDAWLSG